MSKRKWTPEQESAIKTDGCNLLVAAAAGAGKTSVLVERIIEKITNPDKKVDIDSLLVVTFTNAAASEMRERIGDALSKRLEEEPESRNLQRQMTLLNKSSIMTIHSFCLEVIRNNFQLLDIDPDFRIADETESTLMKQEAVDEVFEDMYTPENKSDDFLNIVDAYGGKRDDSNLKDMVLSLYNFSRSMPDPEKWLDAASENFNAHDDFKFEDSIWAKILVESIKTELKGIKEGYEDAVDVIKSSEELMPYFPNFESELCALNEIVENGGAKWDYIKSVINSFSFEQLKRCKKGYDKAAADEVKKVRDDAKKRINYYRNSIFSFDESELYEDLKKLYPMMKCLSQIVERFESAYAAKKKDKSVIDFSDIEHYCIDILTVKDEEGVRVASETAKTLRQKYDEILIDEYQDSNDVQELILNMVSKVDEGKPNIFMVGDVKQSIYRFRQAKPQLFMNKYLSYSSEEGADKRKITLFKNFRSRKEIIDGVNYIFRQIMSRDIGELDYDESEMLNYGANYPAANEGIAGGNVELCIVESKKDDVDENETESEDEEDIDAIQLEARYVAGKIKEIVSDDDNKFYVLKKVTVKNKETGMDEEKLQYVRAGYNDIVILMRATTNYAPVFKDELSAAGIPVYADTGDGYFDTVEIKTFLSLLQIIDNPLQDISLIAVLRSPMFNFSPEDLISIREKSKDAEFYRALEIKSGDDDDTGRKSLSFVEKLKKWRHKSPDMSISKFIWYLYNETGYYAYSAALPGGVQRQANLRILFERAKQFENTSYKGLFNFINFIERLKSTSGDMGSAKILGENEDVVRIMSIHKSKGLEFPIVFLSGTGKKFNMMDLNRDILFHSELGYGPDFVDTEKRVQYPTIMKQAIKQKMKVELLSEEMRILYVAMTRAKEKLFITGNVRNIDSAVAKWKTAVNNSGSTIPEYYILSSSSYLDLIGPCIMKHKDGGILRDTDGNCHELSLQDDESKWSVNLIKRKDIIESGREEIQKEQNVIEKLRSFNEDNSESEYKDEIEKRLSWKYAYSGAFKMPAVLSVTELKAQAAYDDEKDYTEKMYRNDISKRPAFMQNYKSIGPAERGTIMHLVMQKLDLANVSSEDDIKSQLDSLIARNFITEEQAKAVDISSIEKFFESSLGMRMVSNRDSVKRETDFNMFMPACDVYGDADRERYKDEKILIRGVIDCYFYDSDGIVIIDYKTDYVKDEKDEEKIKDRYNIQIEYYEKALKKIEPDKNVKEKYLYLFKNGHILKM